LLFLLAFYIRVEPYLYAPDIPYGLRDAAFHYQVGKLLFEGKSPSFVWNGLGINLRHENFYYPPLSYYVPAYAARLTGDFQHTVYVVAALFCSLAVVSTFLLVRELFGDYPALAGATFIALSIRDVSSQIWGQWHSSYSLVFAPLIIYFGMKSLKDGRFLYLCSLSAGLCLLTYPQTILIPLLSLVFFIVLSTDGRLPWKGTDILGSIVLFALLALPMIPGTNSLVGHAEGEGSGAPGFVSSLIRWYPADFEKVQAYPKEWYDPIGNYSVFGILLIASGAIILFKDRSPQGRRAFLLIVAMILAFYLAVHLTQLLSLMRALKLIVLEPYIFAVAFAAPFSKKIVKDKRVKVAAVILLAFFILWQARLLYGVGERLFPIGIRLTPNEMAALDYLREKTGDRSLVAFFGNNDVMLDWGTVLSERLLLAPKNGGFYIENEPVKLSGEVYFLFDANMPFMDNNRRQEEVQKLIDLNTMLQNTSVISYANDEVVIRRYIAYDPSKYSVEVVQEPRG